MGRRETVGATHYAVSQTEIRIERVRVDFRRIQLAASQPESQPATVYYIKQKLMNMDANQRQIGQGRRALPRVR